MTATRRTVLLSGALAAAAVATDAVGQPSRWPAHGYAAADDGHQIYFETYSARNAGVPIVLLHGGVMSIDTAFAPAFIPHFARTRRVIAIEQQGHGHTADRAGAITFDRMVADTIAVLDHLGVPQADFLGHSMGGMISIRVAIQHPERVRALIAMSAAYRLDGMLPEIVEMNRNPTHTPSAELVPLLPTQADFAAWTASYQRNAPNPAAFQDVLGKLNRMLVTTPDLTPEQLGAIRAKTLLIIGDHDFFTPAHLDQMRHLIPDAQLAILPGTTHVTVLNRIDWIAPLVDARLATIAR